MSCKKFMQVYDAKKSFAKFTPPQMKDCFQRHYAQTTSSSYTVCKSWQSYRVS